MYMYSIHVLKYDLSIKNTILYTEVKFALIIEMSFTQGLHLTVIQVFKSVLYIRSYMYIYNKEKLYVCISVIIINRLSRKSTKYTLCQTIIIILLLLHHLLHLQLLPLQKSVSIFLTTPTINHTPQLPRVLLHPARTQHRTGHHFQRRKWMRWNWLHLCNLPTQLE